MDENECNNETLLMPSQTWPQMFSFTIHENATRQH